MKTSIFIILPFRKVINLLPLKCSELIRMLSRAGWIVVRQSGSHMIMKHLEKKGTIIVPNHGS